MDTFNEMVRLYKAQKLQDLAVYISEESEDFGEFEEILLFKRNESWIPIMQEMMSDMPTFFAVGAGHLGGKRGVIDLLEKEGYTLTPLREVAAKP